MIEALRRRRTLLWTTAFAALLVLAVQSGVTANAGPSHTEPLAWGPCPAGPAAVVVDPAQICATLTLPLDHLDPGGATLDVAVSRIPASDPATRRGVLLLNPGGPGGEGLHLPSALGPLMSPAVLATYDRIGFDPRGVGRSSPVTCGLSAAELLPNTPYPDAAGSITANVAFARSAAARCEAHGGDVLPFITTANTARDMDLIRSALGERRISYYGGSYGTYLGAVYASLFPGHTDRFVLDSAVDPTQIWYDEFRGQSAGLAERFPDVARYAAENVATIGFGATADEVTATYVALAARLDTAPVAVPGSAVALTGNLLRFMTFNLLYQDLAIPPLAQAWRAAADLADGRAAAEQVELLLLVLQRLAPESSTSPGVPADNSVAAAYAVTCGDVQWPTDVDEYADNVASDLAAFPLSGGFAAGIWPCAFWASGPAEPPVEIGPDGPRNILILQFERDPATPLDSALAMQRALGERAALVTVTAGGHGVYGAQSPGSCADEATTAFLTTGTVPGQNLTCPPG